MSRDIADLRGFGTCDKTVVDSYDTHAALASLRGKAGCPRWNWKAHWQS